MSANGLVPPLHLGEVKHPVYFHSSVNLLDDSLSLVAPESERLPNEKPGKRKQAVEDPLKPLSPLV